MSGDLSLDEAKSLVEDIRCIADDLWDRVKAAYVGRAWVALGYSSWDELCSAEFGDLRVRLPREDRQEVVMSLREANMSTRAIASATGMGKTQISDDLRGVRNRTPEPAPVTGVDGKTYTIKPREQSIFINREPEPNIPTLEELTRATEAAKTREMPVLSKPPADKALSAMGGTEHYVTAIKHLQKAIDTWSTHGQFDGLDQMIEDLENVLDTMKSIKSSRGIEQDIQDLMNGEN